MDTDGELNSIQRSTPVTPLHSFTSLIERISPEKKIHLSIVSTNSNYVIYPFYAVTSLFYFKI